MSKPTGKLKFAYETIACMEQEVNRLTAENEALRQEVEQLRKALLDSRIMSKTESALRSEIDGWKYSVRIRDEKLRSSEQERDQLKADNQSLQMKHDILAAKIEAIQLRDCQRDADVIERAAIHASSVTGEDDLAVNFHSALMDYAHQLRQQPEK